MDIDLKIPQWFYEEDQWPVFFCLMTQSGALMSNPAKFKNHYNELPGQSSRGGGGEGGGDTHKNVTEIWLVGNLKSIRF